MIKLLSNRYGISECSREQLSKDSLKWTRIFSRTRLFAREREKVLIFRTESRLFADESLDYSVYVFACGVTRTSYRCNGLPLITHELRRDSRWESREATARRIAQLPDAVIPLRPACWSKSPMERGGFTFVNWHKKTEPRDRDDSQLDFFFSLLFSTEGERPTTVELRCFCRGESSALIRGIFSAGTVSISFFFFSTNNWNYHRFRQILLLSHFYLSRRQIHVSRSYFHFFFFIYTLFIPTMIFLLNFCVIRWVLERVK